MCSHLLIRGTLSHLTTAIQSLQSDPHVCDLHSKCMTYLSCHSMIWERIAVNERWAARYQHRIAGEPPSPDWGALGVMRYRLHGTCHAFLFVIICGLNLLACVT
jgi:hypothetical protein